MLNLCCLILKRSLFVFDRERDQYKKEELLHQTGMLTLMSDSLKYIQKISKISDKIGYTFIIQV